MYDETIARIAVISAAVISMARLLLIALLVCSIGKVTTTAPARSPGLGDTQCLPSAVGRDRWLSKCRVFARRGSPSGSDGFEEDRLDVLELPFFRRCIRAVICCWSHIGRGLSPDVRRTSRERGHSSARLERTSRAASRSNSSRGCFSGSFVL